jgi:DNA polymerase III epsilon subunit-like protein
MPYARRECEICHRLFTPPRSGNFYTTNYPDGEFLRWCPECRRTGDHARNPEETQPYAGLPMIGSAGPLPVSDVLPRAETHALAAPMRQVVFDLETWGLDRGWGVTMVAALLVHGEGVGPKWYEFDLRSSPDWPNVRSKDESLVAQVLKVLSTCHIAYAHNGLWFDFAWLRTAALKYNLPPVDMKLIDPVQILRRRYRLGKNSLEALADFLQLPQQKLHISPDVWRAALLDNSDEAWGLLKARCRSDVELLNAAAGRMTNDVGMVDSQGSMRR